MDIVAKIRSTHWVTLEAKKISILRILVVIFLSTNSRYNYIINVYKFIDKLKEQITIIIQELFNLYLLSSCLFYKNCISKKAETKLKQEMNEIIS